MCQPKKMVAVKTAHLVRKYMNPSKIPVYRTQMYLYRLQRRLRNLCWQQNILIPVLERLLLLSSKRRQECLSWP